MIDKDQAYLRQTNKKLIKKLKELLMVIKEKKEIKVNKTFTKEDQLETEI